MECQLPSVVSVIDDVSGGAVDQDHPRVGVLPHSAKCSVVGCVLAVVVPGEPDGICIDRTQIRFQLEFIPCPRIDGVATPRSTVSPTARSAARSAAPSVLTTTPSPSFRWTVTDTFGVRGPGHPP